MNLEPFVFEWKIFPGHTALKRVQEVHYMMEKDNIQPKRFLKDRIIFMSMCKRHRLGPERQCKSDSSDVAAYARRFPKGRWSFLGPGSEEAWHATLAHKPDVWWNRVAERMMLTFGESGHLVLSALARRRLKNKGGRRTSTHYNGDPTTGWPLLRIIVSVNQRSIYGATAD